MSGSETAFASDAGQMLTRLTFDLSGPETEPTSDAGQMLNCLTFALSGPEPGTKKGVAECLQRGRR